MTKAAQSAIDLLARFGIHEPPVPVEDIATSSGIHVVRSAAEWSESGFLLRDTNRTIIGINSRNSPKRQRFTIAHEIGHYLLHAGKPLIVDQSIMRINKRDDVSSQASNDEEIEANQFAAELLMPQALINVALGEHLEAGVNSRDDLIASLARRFDVSNDAMGWRLINIGILSS